MYCKVYKATPTTPRMGPLPPARLGAFNRPFSFVGLDYFGSMQVRVGRTRVKRWVALFTCLSIRAVHLEVVHSLSTMSCKMAIRRFVARRGSPVEFYSDNGTNFVGASNELKSELKSINGELAETFTNAKTKWLFNPPSSPHMGGAWERLVRSVKAAFFAMSTSRCPDEETFATLLVEAEGIVNSRPLTFVPLEAGTQEALTPNHFLLASSNGVVQPARTLSELKSVGRSDWNLCRHLVDLFWRRWVKEYLPMITRRTKWLKDTRSLQSGDLVVIVEEPVRNGWIRGRVLETRLGRDGRVRRAVIQTSTGTVLRPATKLALLDVQEGKTGSQTQDQFYGSEDVTAYLAGPSEIPRSI
ncbi:uncharacterized protein LOC131687094 [Topomyia yanbarensis]|uniref:uncharacterized protein LOC131687094 n=1 Tax=Topomyia yanbarensis TaxID=2498891 RepID=UPI00273C1974|nr:uncharacterized protein LOC131687094 [Topomyia yanbarensis]